MSIATKLAKLKTIKQDIKSALEEKGQTPSNVFSTYANNIRAIETGGITPSGEIKITENGTYDVTNYASANVNIASSGGSDLDSYIEGNLTEINSNATKIYNSCFYNNQFITKCNFPSATNIGEYAFNNCSNLVSINAPKVTYLNKNAFYYCSQLNEINFNSATYINMYVFSNCINLIDLEFNNVEIINGDAFYQCMRLNSIKIPLVTGIYAEAFRNCYSLKEILIEQTNSICTLGSTNVFTNCYHILGTTNSTWNPNGLKDGYIYVPHTLLTQYKVATNWVQFKSQIIGLGDFASGDTLPNYADYNTYKTCKWYSDKELTQSVYEITMIASGEFVVDSGSANITTAGRYYCKLD